MTPLYSLNVSRFYYKFDWESGRLQGFFVFFLMAPDKKGKKNPTGPYYI